MYFCSFMAIKNDEKGMGRSKHMKEFFEDYVESLIVYGWTYLKVNKALLSYFYADSSYIFSISDILKILWARK